MIDQQLADLRAKAEAATPGPWVRHHERYGVSVRNADGGFDWVGSCDTEADCNFVTSASTATVLALLDEIERLRVYEDSLRAIVQDINAKRNQGSSEIGLGGAYLAFVELLADNDRLRERNAKLERVAATAAKLIDFLMPDEIGVEGSDLEITYRGAVAEAKEATMDKCCGSAVLVPQHLRMGTRR